MPILGIMASAMSGNLFAPSGAYDSIATTTVGGTAVASITFSSIPATYTHLQIRASARGSASADDFRFQLNSDTGSNYSRHFIYGNGSSAAAGAAASSGVGTVGVIDNTASVFTVAVMDILDYTNTNKYTTARTLSGYDANGSGYAFFASTAWMNTAAVTSVTLFPQSSNFVQYSSFALYGIKGA